MSFANVENLFAFPFLIFKLFWAYLFAIACTYFKWRHSIDEMTKLLLKSADWFQYQLCLSIWFELNQFHYVVWMYAFDRQEFSSVCVWNNLRKKFEFVILVKLCRILLKSFPFCVIFHWRMYEWLLHNVFVMKVV